MNTKIAKLVIGRFLNRTYITLGGKKPQDLIVHNDKFYDRVIKQGSLGLGESYMDGWWDCEHLDEFFYRLLRTGIPKFVTYNPISLSRFLKSKLVNHLPKSKAFEIGEHHYDLGNDLFQEMLGPTMAYSCGYWREACSLEEAQRAKWELVCRKIKLKPGQRILEIGCGWGGFAHYAATNYGASVVGLTVSKEQAEYARVLCQGLPVEIRLQDYRDVNEQSDHIVSIGMFEHVGPKNYRTYMKVAKQCLKPGGLFLLHTIGSPSGWFKSPDPWIGKYIFPGGHIPTYQEITSSTRGHLEILDFHEFGDHYDLTLMEWHKRFVEAWIKLEAKYGEQVNGKFKRMWEYYLLMCAGSFRACHLELYQIVLAHRGEHEDYLLVR